MKSYVLAIVERKELPSHAGVLPSPVYGTARPALASTYAGAAASYACASVLALPQISRQPLYIYEVLGYG